MVNQLDRLAVSGVFCTFFYTIVFRYASGKIGGDAGVTRVVPTTDNIYIPALFIVSFRGCMLVSHLS